MNTINRLQRAISNPRLFARWGNRMYHRRFGIRSENPHGIEIFAKDWDNLVVLDACRYDMFNRICTIDGLLSPVESRGSTTTEWLRANIDGRDLNDTVYVTANPQLERHRDNWDVNFQCVVNVWLDDGWDKETGTVLADTMNKAALDTYQNYPNKRLVIHYMQPHYPFVTADTTFDKSHLASIEEVDDTVEGENVWNQKFFRQIDVSDETLWNLYTGNLEYVLEYVEELLECLSGKTVITSDHGNYVGERAYPIPIREYGHRRGLYDKPLVLVPWLEYETDQRRNIRSDAPETQSRIESETVEQRLQDLGYVD